MTSVKTEDSECVSVKEEIPELMDETKAWLHTTLEFLKPEKIKDITGRKRTHPDYDARTLFVPEDFYKTLTPAMRQWWKLKTNHYDCVLFFKVGKFYELYHMDATVGVQELGFSYMRGEFAHSGFPEQAYDRMSTTLIERGYKVARVEQTETPDMMQERCKTIKGPSKFDKVVKREVCQITNSGTQVYGQQVQLTMKHKPNFMLSIVERDSRYGICFIDTSIGDFFIGEFDDDTQLSRIHTLIAHNPPVLVLSERNGNSSTIQHAFKTVLSNAMRETLANEKEFWSGEKTLKFLTHFYANEGDEMEWPEVLKMMQDDDDHLGLTPKQDFSLALKALGGCIWYLSKCFLDQQVLAMSRFNLYTPPDDLCEPNATLNDTRHSLIDKKHMILDSITLSNLKITGDEHSLLSKIDHCCTKFGKRLLHHWICSPSCEVEVIRDRQEAVTELLENMDVLQDIRQVLGALPDLERQLAQIHTFGNRNRLKNHPDGRAILYEEKTYGKKKIQDFISTLDGFESLMSLPKLFRNCNSNLLVKLTQFEPKGKFPDVNDTLKFFKNAFNREEALKVGVIAPEQNVDAEYDSIEEEIKNINEELQQYLKKQEKYFGCRVAYFGTDKKRFQLEVPESNAKKAGKEYALEGQKKGSKPVKRYHTEETKQFLKRMIQTEDRKKAVLKDLSRRIFEKFSKKYSLWKCCVELVGILDVLTSFAEYARNLDVNCTPEIIDNNQETDNPILVMEDGVHPCMTSSDFIPNGISIGYTDNSSPLVLLTGPNMGGKSTLMRQVGLLAVLAQMGSRIPAVSCKMSLIDRIFTRLGAQDDIIAGHSTFLVELNETSAILKHSSVNSLVLLDELGRGTATYDGTAIAASVVNFLAKLNCRSLFSTHYHSLVDNFQNDKRIKFGHMSCMVENEIDDDNDDPTKETVTFLYKYVDGPCPKSYGFNAAKLAGMPIGIIKRAYEFSKKIEAAAQQRKLFIKLMAMTEVSDVREIVGKLKTCMIK